MAAHDSIEDSAGSPRMIPSRHKYDRSELVLIGPRRKDVAFTFRSSFGPGNLNDIRYAKPPQLTRLPCGSILVRQPSSYEFKVLPTRRVCKDCNSRRDAALNQVRCFQRTRASGISRNNDDICWRNWLIDHKRPSYGSQNGIPNGRNSYDRDRY
jgi:hypothetical protein